MTRAKSKLTLQRPKNAKKKRVVRANVKKIGTSFAKHGHANLANTSRSRSPLCEASPVHKKRKVIPSRCLFTYSAVVQLETINLCSKQLQDPKDPTDDQNNKATQTDFEPETEYEMLNEIIGLLPEVLRELSENHLDHAFLSFFRQIKDKKFPLTNIALSLWLEVVQWFDHKTSTNMRYSDQTKLFWKLGWRMFGGRFLHFMGGYKNYGEVAQNKGTRGLYRPDQSEVNFAVPDHSTLRSHDPFNVEGERGPGMYADIMESLGSSLDHQSACLTFDGKKLKMGLRADSGDVDLLGHELQDTLKERQCALKRSVDDVNDIQLRLHAIDGSVNNLKLLPSSYKTEVHTLLINTVTRISGDMFSVREIRRKKEYCKSKLIERGGENDWRKGKYAYAVSAIIAFLHDIDNYLTKAHELSERICITIASLNERDYVTGKSLDIHASPFFVDIDGQKENKSNPIESTRFMKQRSDEWFAYRSVAKVTGSTLYTAISGEGMKRQMDHFEKVMCHIPEKETTPDQKKAMEHGVVNEINAVTTVVGKVLPVLEPELKFCEEGCLPIQIEETETNDVFMVVSPDGSLRKDSSFVTTQVGIEIKCPFYKVHTTFPSRYLLQCLSQIEVLDVNYLLFVSWTSDETVVFKVKRDTQLFKEAMQLAFGIYGKDKVKKPTKQTDEQKQMKKRIVETSKGTELVGRFSSLVLSQNDTDTTFAQPVNMVTELQMTLEQVKAISETHYDINRERASEAVVFIVSDLDRSWEKEKVKWSPVAWFPKGYSLTTGNMRAIAEDVHDRSHDTGIHIPCSSFNGQWHGIVVRSNHGEPLTKLQLQKTVWKRVVDMTKGDLVAELNQMNKTPAWKFVDVLITNSSTEYVHKRVIEAVYEAVYPTFRRIPKPDVADKEPEESNMDKKPTLSDDLSVHDLASSSSNTDKLGKTIIDEEEEFEVFRVTINESELAEEVIENQNDAQQTNNDETSAIDVHLHVNNTQNTGKSDSVPEMVPVESRQTSLTGNDMSCILSLFKTTKDCNKHGKWNDTTPASLNDCFRTRHSLMSFLDVELRAIVRYLKKRKSLKINESSTKQIKVNEICKYLNLECPPSEEKCRKVSRRNAKSLSEMASHTISKKISKQELNIWYAEYIWPDCYQIWYSSVEDLKINGQPYIWFYKPEYSSSRNQFEVRCVDSSHLLTRCRQKSCKGGLHDFSSENWRKVAATRKTLLTKVMVDEVIDPMSVPMATTHFSEQVEQIMRSNNDDDCADLCSDICNWWESEDESGIQAIDRIKQRQGLRDRLLNCVDFAHFPPVTVSVKGWPIQLWEALLANIDAKALLYGLCHGGTYNVRSFSSMIGETFFSELVLNDKRGRGTVTCQEFGQFIGNTIEKVQARLDPDRCFSYRTSRSNVYNLVEESEQLPASQPIQCRVCFEGKDVMPKNIIPINHPFDSDVRKRLKGRRKMETVSTSRNSAQRGTLGVRWETARRDDSKILPSDKMGLHN